MKQGCIICGEALFYTNDLKSNVCHICKGTFETNTRCVNGHFVCDACHSAPAFEVIMKYCGNSDSVDPVSMAVELFRHPSVKMHGPEHHFLVPAVLLTACYNSCNDQNSKLAALKESEKRSKNILGGFCGFYGVCGAAIGSGIFLSILTKTTPLSDSTWKMCNLHTADVLKIIAENGGPRCCKRDTYIALSETITFINKNFEIKLPLTDNILCNSSGLNKECLKGNCRFYKKSMND